MLTVVGDKPDVLIDVEINDINSNASHVELSSNIIKTGLNCKKYSVNEVLFSSGLVNSFMTAKSMQISLSLQINGLVSI